MSIWYLVPMAVGFCIALQGILNKQFASAYGLATASLLNAFVFAVMAFGLFVVSQKFPLEFPEFLPPKLSHYEFSFWHLIPGLCGLAIVMLTPWSISHLGAAPVFVLVITAQLLLSAAWDHWVSGAIFSPLKLLGLGLVTLGAALFSLSK